MGEKDPRISRICPTRPRKTNKRNEEFEILKLIFQNESIIITPNGIKISNLKFLRIPTNPSTFPSRGITKQKQILYLSDPVRNGGDARFGNY